MYRFRPIDNLLDKYQELEKQEIYFATPEELNDPMEGYRDLFWKGDKIVWKNFLINYIKSAEHFFLWTIGLNETRKIGEQDIRVLSTARNYPTPIYREKISQIIDKVFETKFINEFPDFLAKRISPVRRDELLIYMQTIHPHVIDAISEIHYESHGTNRPFFNPQLDGFSEMTNNFGNLADLTNKIELENTNKSNLIENFFSAISLTYQQTRLLGMYKNDGNDLSSNSFFLISEFPEKYISKLESSIYPEWFCASFLSDCSNSAIWGHYGDNHKGVCLKFKTVETDKSVQMNLEVEYGYSTKPLIGMRPQTFTKMEYHNKHVAVDFFRAIGRLTKGELNAIWYSDGEGNMSVCGEHLNKDEDEWRNKYWENYYKSFSVKLSEWAYEKEYRLIVHGDLTDFTKKEARKFKYNFKDLEGIIFGIKTSTADKIRILKIVVEKCKKENRKDFDFYQAYYSKKTGKIETDKLNLLKFD